jgi:hypothetical protein
VNKYQKESNKKEKTIFVMNADLEEPKCCRCDNFHCYYQEDKETVCDKCGSEYGWYNYRRTEEL